jgi:hypothetical protein
MLAPDCSASSCWDRPADRRNSPNRAPNAVTSSISAGLRGSGWSPWQTELGASGLRPAGRLGPGCDPHRGPTAILLVKTAGESAWSCAPCGLIFRVLLRTPAPRRHSRRRGRPGAFLVRSGTLGMDTQPKMPRAQRCSRTEGLGPVFTLIEPALADGRLVSQEMHTPHRASSQSPASHGRSAGSQVIPQMVQFPYGGAIMFSRRRRIVTLVSSLLLAGGLAAAGIAATAVPASASPIIKIRLTNASQFCINVTNNVNKSGQPIQLWTCTGAGDDSFAEIADPNCTAGECMQFQVPNTSLCIEGPALSGGTVTLGACNSGRGTWYPTCDPGHLGNGFLANRGDLSVYGPLGNGKQIYAAPCTGSGGNTWQNWSGP